MRTLLIDNYDSYTYNLFQVIAEVNGELPLVYYNDEITLEQVQSMVEAGTVHNIVISPGPGTPNNPHDIGVCLDVLQHLPKVPILGICLGHQALALAHGGKVVSAPEPVHGRLSRLRHNGHKLFRDVPSGDGFEVVRYHSLLVDEASLPECLQPVCWTAGAHAAVKLARDCPNGTGTAPGGGAPATETAHDTSQPSSPQPPGLLPAAAGATSSPSSSSSSLLMGLAHRSQPHYGVQFHPESVATRYGIALLRNFRDLSAEHIRTQGPAAAAAAAQLPAEPRLVADIVGPPGRLSSLAPWPSPEHQRGAPLRLAWSRMRGLLRRLPEGGSQAVFERLYGWAQDTFWLDSAATDRGRFSYMGGRGGPLWRKYTYKLPPPGSGYPHGPGGQQQQQQQEEQQRPQAAGDPSSGQDQDPQTLRLREKDTQQQQQQQQQQQEEDAEQATGAAAADPDSDAASSASSGSSASACCDAGGSGSSGAHPGSSAATSASTASAGTSVAQGEADAPPPPLPHAAAAAAHAGTLVTETASGHVRRQVARGGFLAFLHQVLGRQRLLVEAEAAAQLPFNFWGGLVGYLGYELKAECGAANAHAASTPDAVMYLADRVVAVDHAEGDVYLLALYDSDRSSMTATAEAAEQKARAQAEAWLEETQRLLEAAAAEREEGEGGQSRLQEQGGWGCALAAGAAPGPGSRSTGQSPAAAAAAAAGGGGDQQEIPAGCVRGADGQEVEGTCVARQHAHGQLEGAGEGPRGSAARGRCCGGDPGVQAVGLEPDAAASTRQQQLDTHEQTQQQNAQTQQQQQHHHHHHHFPSKLNQQQPHIKQEQPQQQQQQQPPVVPFRLEHSRDAYLRNIAACHAALHAGESYEVCLTTALARPAAPDPPALYRTLRQLNPAPYAAWLQCGPEGPTICCSSPERFLRGDRGGLLEARPIKGTAARVAGDPAADAAAATELASSEKERAENLMIVDLLRNDLGRVCEVGSVHVPGLMDIESYATVHQMVSTVRGVRRQGMSVVDCIRAAFPGGSMTGAPKVRTMQIIDALEGRARGVYSGCIGFISLNDTFDLNIVIRTAVIEQGQPQDQQSLHPHTAGDRREEARRGARQPGAQGQEQQRCMSIGAGGAIVVQSQPEAEYEEMRLKARALLRAVGLCEGGQGPIPVVSE